MKKILIIIYLILAILSLLSEVILNFRETKKSICTLNFQKNFSVEKIYYKKSFSPSLNDNSQGLEGVVGYLKNDPKYRYLTLTEETARKYRKNENGNIYYNVWYNKKLDIIILKTDNTGSIYYNGFLLLLFWIFTPLAIFNLIKYK